MDYTRTINHLEMNHRYENNIKIEDFKKGENLDMEQEDNIMVNAEYVGILAIQETIFSVMNPMQTRDPMDGKHGNAHIVEKKGIQ